MGRRRVCFLITPRARLDASSKPPASMRLPGNARDRKWSNAKSAPNAFGICAVAMGTTATTLQMQMSDELAHFQGSTNRNCNRT